MSMDFKVIRFPKNQGHAFARQAGLDNSCNDLVAIMDSDDIAMPYRFEKQLECFSKNPKLSVVGGQITEFIGKCSNIIGQRNVPVGDFNIKRYLRRRCPMNLMTVMMSKEDINSVGGFKDWFCEEDYYLWIRMLLEGCRFENLKDVLVNVRVGKDMYARRGGWKYFKSEAGIQKLMLEKNIINLPLYLQNVFIRFIVQVLSTNKLRAFLFSLARKNDFLPKSENNAIAMTENEEKEIKDYPPFSVAMSVYKNDNAEWFDNALQSIIEQTVKPSEIVLVVDGPVPASIDDVIVKYTDICNRGG